MDCKTSGSVSPGRIPNFLVFKMVLPSVLFCNPEVSKTEIKTGFSSSFEVFKKIVGQSFAEAKKSFAFTSLLS